MAFMRLPLVAEGEGPPGPWQMTRPLIEICDSIAA